MKRKDIIKLIGVAVTGLGMIFVPLLHNKYLMALDWILFSYFTFSLMHERFKKSGIGIKDFSDSLDNEFYESTQKKKYKKAVVYLSVKPIMIISLLWLLAFIIIFLLNY